MNRLFCRFCLGLAAALVLSASPHPAVGQETLPSLKAEPTKAAAPRAASPTNDTDAKTAGKAVATNPGKARPLSVTVTLSNNSWIEGTLTDTSQLQMQTSFGTASIPLSEVAGIRFASADDASTTVVMLNGDSITGATDVKLITVETDWGTASINGPSMASIMFVPGLRWNSLDGLNGKRWSLVDAKSPETSDRGNAAILPQPSSSSLPSNATPVQSNQYDNRISQPFFSR